MSGARVTVSTTGLCRPLAAGHSTRPCSNVASRHTVRVLRRDERCLFSRFIFDINRKPSFLFSHVITADQASGKCLSMVSKTPNMSPTYTEYLGIYCEYPKMIHPVPDFERNLIPLLARRRPKPETPRRRPLKRVPERCLRQYWSDRTRRGHLPEWRGVLCRGVPRPVLPSMRL